MNSPADSQTTKPRRKRGPSQKSCDACRRRRIACRGREASVSGTCEHCEKKGALVRSSAPVCEPADRVFQPDLRPSVHRQWLYASVPLSYILTGSLIDLRHAQRTGSTLCRPRLLRLSPDPRLSTAASPMTSWLVLWVSSSSLSTMMAVQMDGAGRCCLCPFSTAVR